MFDFFASPASPHAFRERLGLNDDSLINPPAGEGGRGDNSFEFMDLIFCLDGNVFLWVGSGWDKKLFFWISEP